MGRLAFEVLSGGTVEFDLAQCGSCSKKPCVEVCGLPSINGPLIIGEDGLPALRLTLEEVKHGGCSECLGCELECGLSGRNTVRITLPIPVLDVTADAASSEA